jgi:hypothetical protein
MSAVVSFPPLLWLPLTHAERSRVDDWSQWTVKRVRLSQVSLLARGVHMSKAQYHEPHHGRREIAIRGGWIEIWPMRKANYNGVWGWWWKLNFPDGDWLFGDRCISAEEARKLALWHDWRIRESICRAAEIKRLAKPPPSPSPPPEAA